MDSTHSQDKIQDTQKNLIPFEQDYSEIRVDSQINEGKAGKQSNSLGAHQWKTGEEDEKSEDTHQRVDDVESMQTNNRIEGREIGEENGREVGPRERLKRHRSEVAGQVWIPEMWGQENFLKDWIDCSAFDACLVPQGIMSARASLIEEARRTNSRSIRVQNSC